MRRNLRRPEIRDADVARLALAHDVVQRAKRLLEGCVQIGPMDQVDFHVIGAKVAQALLDRSHDPRAAAVAAVRRLGVADADLGHERDFCPPRPQRAAERLLGYAHTIRLGGVEAVDARIERAMNGPFELSRINRAVGATDFPAAKTDCGNVQVRTAKLAIFHRVSPHTRQ